MRVRGLKLLLTVVIFLPFMSHPMRVRGLKHCTGREDDENYVAPHAGAWIETGCSYTDVKR